MFRLIAPLLLLLLSFNRVFAQPAGGTDGDSIGGTDSTSITIPNPLGEGATIESLLQRIIDFLAFTIGPVIVVLMVVIAAFQMITAGGNPDKISSGRKTLTFALVGYAIILLADGLISVIKDILGVETSGAEGMGAQGLVDIFSNLVDWFFYITLIIAVAAFIFAAFLFITASGDPKKQEQAKSVVLYAVIGVGIALLAEAFIAVVGNLVGTDTSGITNPS